MCPIIREFANTTTHTSYSRNILDYRIQRHSHIIYAANDKDNFQNAWQ